MSAPLQVPAEPAAGARSADAAAGSTVGAPRRSSRKLSFDVLRVVFVLLVILYHSTFIGPLVYHDFIPRRLMFAHQVGASLLLVLSAYFVAVTIGKRDVGQWWWGKIARLVPPFAAATVVAWAFLRYLAPDGWYFPSKHDLVANLLMLWNWNGRWHTDYVDGSYWTIPVQLMAFTLAAVIWRHSRWLRQGVGFRALLWFGLLVPLIQLPYHLSLPGDALYGSIVDGFGLHRWHLFVAGLVVWMLSTRRIGRLHGGVLLVGCVIAHAAHTGWLNPDGSFGTDKWAVLGIALGMLALLAAATGPDWDGWLPAPARRSITWLAGISYGVFLSHQTIGYVVMIRLQDLGVGPSLQTVAMIANAVVCGWLLTLFVEHPAHRWLMVAWDSGARRVRTWRDGRRPLEVAGVDDDLDPPDSAPVPVRVRVTPSQPPTDDPGSTSTTS